MAVVSGGSPLSGASLGLKAPASEPTMPGEVAPIAEGAPGFRVAEADRYAEGGLLGRGGMGEVRAAHDERLNRPVAIKVPHRGDPHAADRLAAEATITAGLAHPGIVPVHDAGIRPDGRPYYTMPVLEGRSLADALRGAPLAARLRLMRHFLLACEAVAYAHSRGVLHRDLKPSNILVGNFGETRVGDWGLAGHVGEPALAPDGGVLGTRGYMAPEQRRGERLDARADVYALGTTLLELLLGERLPDDRQGAPQEPAEPGVPAELVAIARCARAEAPDARYPDAGALAADVAAWFEGRRVSAHPYSVWERLVRAWSAWRAPLVVGLVAMVALSTSIFIGWRGTLSERDRARAAEDAAIDARRRAESALADAMVGRARDAVEHGLQAEAETLAAGALMLGASAEARGILTRFDPDHRPQLVRSRPLVGCGAPAVSADGSTVACVVNDPVGEGAARVDTLVVLDVFDTLVQRRRVASGARSMALNADGSELAVFGSDPTLRRVNEAGVLMPLSGPDPVPLPDSVRFDTYVLPTHDPNLLWVRARGQVQLVNLREESSTPVRPCIGHIGVDALDTNIGGPLVVGCLDGTVLTGDGPAGPFQTIARVPLEGGHLAQLTLSPEGGIAVASTRGGVAVLGPDGAERQRVRIGSDAATDLALSGDRLAVGTRRDGVLVWDLQQGERLARLPAGPSLVRWLPDGRLRVVAEASVSGGEASVRDWTLPQSPPRTRIWSGEAGVSAVTTSPDGQHLAIGYGDGVVRVHRLDQQAPVRTVHTDDAVVKDLSFSADGAWLAVIGARIEEIRLLSMVDPALDRVLPGQPGRRVGWLPDRLVSAPYTGGLLMWTAPLAEAVASRWPLPRRVADMEVLGSAAYMLVDDGGIWRFDPGRTPELVRIASEPGGVSLGLNGARVWAARRDGLGVWEDGAWRQRRKLERVSQLAIDPTGRWVAVGHLDGNLSVLRAGDLQMVARLSGHVGRVSTLNFDSSGDWLVSGSWDGQTRVWSTRTLATHPDVLRAQAEAGWGP